MSLKPYTIAEGLILPELILLTRVVPLQLLKHGADVNQENENER
jgi:hypothetical protein